MALDDMNKAFLERRGINTKSETGKRWRFLISLVTVVLVYLMVLYALIPARYNLEIGGVMPVTVYAIQKVEDKITTEDARTKAAEQVQPQYSINEIITDRQIGEFKKYYNAILAGRNKALSVATYSNDGVLQISDVTVNAVNSVTVKPLDSETIRMLINYSQEDIYAQFTEIEQAMAAKFKEGIYEQDVTWIKVQLMEMVPSEMQLLNPLIQEGLNLFLISNMSYDEAATVSEQQKARDRVEPIFYAKGQVVSYAGETINSAQYQVLNELGIVGNKSRLDFAMIFGTAIMVSIILFLFYTYLFIFRKKHYQDIKQFLVINIILILTIAACVLTLKWREYLMPIALAGFLTATLIDKKVAVMSNIVVCGIVGLILREAWSAFSVYIFLISGIAGIYVMTRNRQRYNVLFAGVVTGACAFILNISYSFIAERSTAISLTPALNSLGNTAMATLLCVGLTILFEGIFHILTPSVLLDLGNTDKKLLKELVEKAPGTYQHSIMVGNLAEAAADKIGADGLFARTASYYHDIGKTLRPEYYKENQHGENIHDTLPPLESAKIIISHVTDGLAMAQKERLPSEISDIILQHHGTTITRFFYDEAMNMQPEMEIFSDLVNIEDYRYPGPKPRSKEAAIIMLADTLEAVMRLGYDPQTSRQTIVDMVFRKIRDGQLNECELSFKDIQDIIDSFDDTFKAIYHKRIAYK